MRGGGKEVNLISDMDSGAYEVERLLAKTYIEGALCYQVKWKGEDEPTWEPVENLQSVSWMLEEFERNLAGKHIIEVVLERVGQPDIEYIGELHQEKQQ